MESLFNNKKGEKMRSLKHLKNYTPEWDEVMNLELEVVANAYNYKDGEKSAYPKPIYSIKLPNDMTGMELYQSMDGDQPMYPATSYLNMLEEYDLYHDDGLADYPRHDNTKRIFYNNFEKAHASVYFLKKHYEFLKEQEVA
jgi:hypothetical protein